MSRMHTRYFVTPVQHNPSSLLLRDGDRYDEMGSGARQISFGTTRDEVI